MADNPPKIANKENIKGRIKHINIQIGAEISRAPNNGNEGKYIENVINGPRRPRIPTKISIMPATGRKLESSFFCGGG